MITRINEVKTLVKHIFLIVNASPKAQHVIQTEKWITIRVNASVKSAKWF